MYQHNVLLLIKIIRLFFFVQFHLEYQVNQFPFLI